MFKWFTIIGVAAVVAFAYVQSRVKALTHGILSFDFRANGSSILKQSVNLATLTEAKKSVGRNGLLDVSARLVLDAIYLDVMLHATIFGITLNGAYTVKAGTISQLVKITEGIEYTILETPIKLTVFVKLIPA